MSKKRVELTEDQIKYLVIVGEDARKNGSNVGAEVLLELYRLIEPRFGMMQKVHASGYEIPRYQADEIINAITKLDQGFPILWMANGPSSYITPTTN